MNGICVSGCFCPDGTVRNGDTCVLPTECRDCSCNGFGNSKFITFDQNDIMFDGNCTYVLSRDIVENVKGNDGKHTYEASSRFISFKGACFVIDRSFVFNSLHLVCDDYI